MVGQFLQIFDFIARSVNKKWIFQRQKVDRPSTLNPLLPVCMNVLRGRFGNGAWKTRTVIIDVRAAGAEAVTTVYSHGPDCLQVVVDGDWHCPDGRRRRSMSGWTQLTAAGTQQRVVTAPCSAPANTYIIQLCNQSVNQSKQNKCV